MSISREIEKTLLLLVDATLERRPIDDAKWDAIADICVRAEGVDPACKGDARRGATRLVALLREYAARRASLLEPCDDTLRGLFRAARDTIEHRGGVAKLGESGNNILRNITKQLQDTTCRR